MQSPLVNCNDKPRVSVIIPTYNRFDAVVKCVESALKSRLSFGKVEVVVVDDASPNSEILRSALENKEGVLFLQNERNSGVNVSRNRAAKNAKADYLFFLDDDNELEVDAVERLLTAIENNNDLGFVAPITINTLLDGTEVVWTLYSDFNQWTSMPVKKYENIPFSTFKATRELYPTKCAPNAFLVRREAYEKVGGFEENWGMTYDETDFGYRVYKSGYKCAYVPSSITHHHHAQDKTDSRRLRLLMINKPLRTFYFARNRSWFAKRHFTFLQALSVSLIFAPLSALYYCTIALLEHRPDCAWAYLKGTICGMFTKSPTRV